MKKIIYYFLFTLFIPFMMYGQKKDCAIDYEIKNDTINFVKTKEVLLYEKDFGKSTKSLFMSTIKSDDVYYVSIQYLQKDPDFLPITCINYKSLLSIKLLNDKIINCYYVGEEKCDTFLYDSVEKNNIRILTGDFVLRKEDVALLKSSPLATIQIRFEGKAEQFIIREDLNSGLSNVTTKPSQFFFQNLDCLDQ